MWTDGPAEARDLWTLERNEVLSLTPDDFAVLLPLQPRWRDNDSFGHVNNAVYYEYFDTAINTWLLRGSSGADTVGVHRFVVESGCRYLAPVAYPTPLTVAHRVARLGSTSVTFELALFESGDDGQRIAALGRWVHVFVDAATQRPVSIPASTRALLELGRAPRAGQPDVRMQKAN